MAFLHEPPRGGPVALLDRGNECERPAILRENVPGPASLEI
jgi:hypothetical protein